MRSLQKLLPSDRSFLFAPVTARRINAWLKRHLRALKTRAQGMLDGLTPDAGALGCKIACSSLSRSTAR